MPTDLVFGLSVAIRHDDWRTQRQASWGAGNVEVSGYTDLITHVRADARALFGRHVAAAGAETTSPRRRSSARRWSASTPGSRPRPAR